jgi:hypothetical protein
MIAILMKVKNMELPAFNKYFGAPYFTSAYENVVA